jgi:hypothetical protein
MRFECEVQRKSVYLKTPAGLSGAGKISLIDAVWVVSHHISESAAASAAETAAGETAAASATPS